MAIVTTAEKAVNSTVIPPGSRIYSSGNAATPQVLLNQLAADGSIRDVDLYGVLFLGKDEIMSRVFSRKVCERVTFRIIFTSAYTREAVNAGWAKYQLWHLAEIPRHLRRHIRPDVVFLQVSGPDNGGNYSLGTTVEGVLAAVQTAKESGGTVIAERNRRMPFVLGTAIPEEYIDYIVDTDYDLPVTPVSPIDEKSRRIGEIITNLYIEDGSTLQFGIGGVPEAVADAVIKKGVKDLGVMTELFADAMRKLVQKGIVTNKKNRRKGDAFSISSIFLADSREGYDWLHFNSSVQSRPSNYTNSILTIAQQPKMVAINSAIGVDLHGNIWADSLKARRVYSGVGGQSDFIRGCLYSEGGVPVIALKSTTQSGTSKIVDMCPEGITTTGIAADQVVLVTENGAFSPFGLSMGEKAVGIAYLAAPEAREKLLRRIYKSPFFHDPKGSFVDGYPKGFTPYEKAV
ncbi:MAG: acetyl-CoA hydrolase/transferase C-terminal domain-containing protein [Elusimicrobiota bacterium]